MQTQKIKYDGFIGPAYNHDNFAYDQQTCVNLIPEINEVGKGKNAEVASFKDRPGLNQFLRGYSGMRGIFEASDQILYFAATDKLYKILSTPLSPELWSVEVVGEGLNGIDPVMFADNGYALFLSANNTAYVYVFAEGGTQFFPLTDGAYGDTGAGFSPVFLNGRILWLLPGSQQFYWTDFVGDENPNGFLADGLNAAQAEADPEIATCLKILNNDIWIFGRRSIEIWYDTGDSAAPFARRGNSIIPSGCSAPHTIVNIAGTLAWVSQDAFGGPQIVIARGLNPPLRISTHPIEAVLAAYTPQQLLTARAMTMQLDGHDFYILNIPGSGTTWVYDFTASAQMGKPMWSEWKSTTGNGVQDRFRGEAHVMHRGYHIVMDYVDGLHTFDAKYPFDVDRRIMRERTAPVIASGGNFVFFKSITLDFKTGDRTTLSDAYDLGV